MSMELTEKFEVKPIMLELINYQEPQKFELN